VDKLLLNIFFFFVLSVSTIAQNGVWTETTGICNGANITPEEGWQRAVENARANAIKEVVGVYVTEEVYRNISESTVDETSTIHDTFSKLSRSNSYGRIVEEEILSKQAVVDNDIPVYKVTLRARVVEEKGSTDPGFSVEIIMPKSVFYVRGPGKSDELKFEIWASRNCYIYLFNILSDDTVLLLIPNRYVGNNFYSVEKEVQEFEKELSNLSFEVGLPEGKDNVLEALYVVASKNKIDFVSNDISESSGGVIPTYQAAITDIQNWMIQIPRDQRTEFLKSFEIRKSD
jgi:hypothetical protein